jgi:hypothetical protein
MNNTFGKFVTLMKLFTLFILLHRRVSLHESLWLSAPSQAPSPLRLRSVSRQRVRVNKRLLYAQARH